MLPEPDGPVISKTEKVYVPVKEHPDVSIGTEPLDGFSRFLGLRSTTKLTWEERYLGGASINALRLEEPRSFASVLRNCIVLGCFIHSGSDFARSKQEPRC